MAEITFQYDGEALTFDPGKLTTLEGIEMEKLTGLTYMEWAASLEKFSAESVRFLVWMALTRAGKRPDCKYREFDFDMVGLLQTFQADDEDAASPDDAVDPTSPPARAPSKRTSSRTAP